MHAITSFALCTATLTMLSAPARSQQVLTKDFTLLQDIHHPGDGSCLVIGAPGITVDLNGHTISGDGTWDGFAIDNLAGHSNVTIKNGKIENFDVSVIASNASRMRLEQLDIVAAGFAFTPPGRVVGAWGTLLMACDDMRVEDVKVENGAVGLAFDGCKRLVVENLDASDCGAGAFVGHTGIPATSTGSIKESKFRDNVLSGVYLLKTDDFLIEECVASGSNDGFTLGNSALPASNMRVVGCDSFHNDWGVRCIRVGEGGQQTQVGPRLPVDNLLIKDNNLHHNIGGMMLLRAFNSVVKDNRCWNNSDFGLVLVWDAQGNVISNNTMTGNGGVGIGLTVGPGDPPIQGPTYNQIRGNTALRNGVDLLHTATATPNTWTDNKFKTSVGQDIH